MLKTVSPCFHLRFGFRMAQNDRAGEYTNLRYSVYSLDSDSSNSDSESDSDGDSDRDSVSLCFHLRFGFMMAQNDRAGEYINLRYSVFFLASDTSDSDSESNSGSDSDSD